MREQSLGCPKILINKPNFLLVVGGDTQQKNVKIIKSFYCQRWQIFPSFGLFRFFFIEKKKKGIYTLRINL